jgi:hypothetical protein
MIVPVLERGLERAVALSESMDGRGFGFGAGTRSDLAAGWCGLGALLALGGAFVALVGRARPAAIGLAIGGAALLVAAVALASRSRGERVRYRHRKMAAADWAMVAVASGAPLLLGLLSLAGAESLVWSTSPLRWPEFEPLPALALVPLLAPLARMPTPDGRPAVDLAIAPSDEVVAVP